MGRFYSFVALVLLITGGLVRNCAAQGYLDLPVHFVNGHAVTLHHRVANEVDIVQKLSISGFQHVEYKRSAESIPHDSSRVRCSFDRRGRCTRVVNEAEQIEQRYMYNGRKNRVRIWKIYEVVPLTPKRIPTRMSIVTRAKYRQGLAIRERQTRSRITNVDSNGNTWYSRVGGYFHTYRSSACFGLPEEQRSTITVHGHPNKHTPSGGSISAFDSLSRPLLSLRVFGIKMDRGRLLTSPLIDSAVRAIPTDVNQFILIRLADHNLPPAVSGINFDELDDQEADRLDSLTDLKLAFREYADTLGQSAVQSITGYDYSSVGLVIRALVWNTPSYYSDGGIASKDSFSYGSQNRLCYWDQWLFHPPYRYAWDNIQKDTLPVRHIWTFTYDPENRVQSAEHAIWHSPPPSLDSFSRKAMEYFAFDYNPDGTVAGYSKRRDDLDPKVGLPVLSVLQRYKLTYTYFGKRKRGLTGHLGAPR